MNACAINFVDIILASTPGVISLTGGGGKTSLLFALAQALTQKQQPVLCTTTTHMLRPQSTEWMEVIIQDTPPATTPVPGKCIFTAKPPPIGMQEKVVGHTPETIDLLSQKNNNVWLLVEADGAAQRPLKAPAQHEPVVAATTAVVIAVLGLRCLFQPLSSQIAFRLNEITAITGLHQGQTISPQAVARLAGSAQGMFKNAPPGAARLVFCNQSDLPGAPAAGEELAQEIARLFPGQLQGMYVGSLQTKGLTCLPYPTS